MVGRRGLCLLLLLCALLRAATPAGERRRASCRRRVLEPPARLGSAGDGRALLGLRGCRAGCSAPLGCGLGCGRWRFRRRAVRGARLGSRRARRGGGGAEPRRRAGFWHSAGVRGAQSGVGEAPAEPNGFGKHEPVAVELPGPAGRALPAGRPPHQVRESNSTGKQPGSASSPLWPWGAHGAGGEGCGTAGPARALRGSCLARVAWLQPHRRCT